MINDRVPFLHFVFEYDKSFRIIYPIWYHILDKGAIILYNILTVYAQLQHANQILGKVCNYDKIGHYVMSISRSYIIVNFEHFNDKSTNVKKGGKRENTSRKILFSEK